MKKIIQTSYAPEAIGTYNQAIETDSLLFTSGQLGIDPSKGNIVHGGVDAQIDQALLNIDSILRSCGLDKSCIVKTTVFLKNMDDFPSINRSFKAYFGNTEYPTRSTVEVSGLPLNALVEVECIALKK